MKQFNILVLALLASVKLYGQPEPLTYFLPDIAYDKNIPTPEQFFGHQVGEWHLSHDKQYAYMRELARLSPRVKLVEHGRTYEQRPLIHLVITSEANHGRLEDIRTKHLKLSDPDQSQSLDVSDMPLVLYQGYSIHGNEPSGGNAAALVAYYLVAGQSPEIERLLKETVILFDPCFNPDGFQRFSSWVNEHKNLNLTSDPQSREYNEAWPRGRTNHYWFDLNRDWLMVQHPESRGRIGVFHEWKPNILTDHHEMGTNSSFFFMPGEPSRTNPVTPRLNQELTKKIGTYHAAALDALGSLYYSEEGYDDFYYGKGSTYPDANGCIGILFEQASTRGHLQETDNGEMTFAFTIRNQVTTALSTFKASVEMRRELLDYQRNFYRESLAEARRDPRKAFVFGEPYDPARLQAFVEILRRHQIGVYRLGKRLEVNGQGFDAGTAYVVPLEQTQYRTIRGIFDTTTVFEDSLFYDISSWTLPLAFNLPYASLGRQFTPDLLGASVEGAGVPAMAPVPPAAGYAYLFGWDNYFAPRALQYLLKNKLRAKVAMKPFTLEGRRYLQGTILVPVSIQDKGAEELHQLMQIAARATGIEISAVKTGLTPDGIDLGSNSFAALRPLQTMIVVGEGANSNEAGEAWHLLDQRYGLPVSMVEGAALGRSDLSRYNTIIMVDGSYNDLPAAGVEKLRAWIQNGGVLVAMKGAIRWVKDKGLGYVTIKEPAEDMAKNSRPYGKILEDRSANLIEGGIFRIKLDLTHPLTFGFRRDDLPVFRDHQLFLERPANAYASPAVYTGKPVLSGYISKANTGLLANSAAAVVTGAGAGKVICLADNPNFRAFWYGTNKIFANALFFGHTINNSAREQRPKEKTPSGGE